MATRTSAPRAIELLAEQRSHLLVVLSNAQAGADQSFRNWFLGPYQRTVLKLDGVLRGQQYEAHEVDISDGKYPGLPYHYFAIYDLSVDGAAAAGAVLDRIKDLHQRESSAQPPATWLYYPAGERVGRSPASLPSLLTVAFANAIPGQEEDFVEFYITRHLRHALQVPALVSGQCFARTQFQSPGAMGADFGMIAIYEQEGSPEDMRRSFATLPAGALDLPAMDLMRFAEWVYRPCAPLT
jgi:hypothetical protein